MANLAILANCAIMSRTGKKLSFEYNPKYRGNCRSITKVGKIILYVVTLLKVNVSINSNVKKQQTAIINEYVEILLNELNNFTTINSMDIAPMPDLESKFKKVRFKMNAYKNSI